MAIPSSGKRISLTGMTRSSPFSSWRPYSLNFDNQFYQISTGHRGWRNLSGDVGGSWLMTRIEHTLRPIVVHDGRQDGPMICTAINGGFTDFQDLHVDDNKVRADGTKAISIATPNNPSFSLANTVGELRADGLPAIIGSGLLKERTKFLKGSGSEYLNVEFGWKPMMNDLRDFARTVKHSNEIIAGYREGSNRKIRRRHQFKPETETRSYSGNGYHSPIDPGYGTSGSVVESRETRSWFSGAFRYHVPTGTDVVSNLVRYESYANKILGIRLTPSTVWELAPWSWAADWFANTGDVLKNISNLGTDGMVMQYGYQMTHVKNSKTVSTISGEVYTRTQEQKRRIPASPYGFALTFDGLSNRQKAVVAALGLTKVR